MELMGLVISSGFTDSDNAKLLEEFIKDPDNATLWGRLETVKSRLPWARHTVENLQKWALTKGILTSKQKSYVTSLYIDSCVMDDDRIREQREARKLGYRLQKLKLGRVQTFVDSVMIASDTKPLTLGQIRGLRNIASKVSSSLISIPKLTGKTFDGWYEIVEPQTVVDTDDGILYNKDN